MRVHRDLVLRRVTDETLRVGKGDVGRSRAVTLVVGNDLDTVILPDTDARVGGAQVNADSF